MRRLPLFIFIAVMLTACSVGDDRAATGAAEVAVEYNPVLTDSLIAHESGASQADYAAMIDQCRALNRRVAEKLRNVNLTDSMTEAQIDSVMKILADDKEVTGLEHHSQKLLTILARADLDEANRDRYAAMVEEAERLLRQL